MTCLVRSRFVRASGARGTLKVWYVQFRLGWVRSESGRAALVRIPAMADRGESLRFLHRVEQLRQARIHGRSLSADLSKWVEELEPARRDRLERLGLLADRIERIQLPAQSAENGAS